MKPITLLAAALLAATACRAPDPRPVARDPVCLRNGDLGCVTVQVDEKTPRATHRGMTYYFCAEGCRKEFEKDPDKYVP